MWNRAQPLKHKCSDGVGVREVGNESKVLKSVSATSK
jgi:hypothetical protein